MYLPEEKHARNYHLDLLRTVAIIAVLIIHSATRYSCEGIENIIGGFFSNLSKPCIAIFLFISGSLFRTGQDYNYLKKKLCRVIYPYLLFSIIAVIYTNRNDLRTVLNNIENIFIDILIGNVFGIYFFIFVILGTYLIAFFVGKLVVLERYIKYIVPVTFILNLLHAIYFEPFAASVGMPDRWKTLYQYRSLLVWLPFFFFGMLFRAYDLYDIIDRYKKIIRATWVMVFVALNVFYFSFNVIGDYNSIIGTFYSTATILLLLTFNVKSIMIDFISKLSYLIYLSHIFFVYILQDIVVKPHVWLAAPSFVISIVGPLFIYYIFKIIFGERSLYIIGVR